MFSQSDKALAGVWPRFPSLNPVLVFLFFHVDDVGTDLREGRGIHSITSS